MTRLSHRNLLQLLGYCRRKGELLLVYDYMPNGSLDKFLHRDVKASNVLLDAEMNARFDDFGLSRLHDHCSNPRTTHFVGTVGYLAPELCKTGKSTSATDVFAFGIFLLEVARGRRPIGIGAHEFASEDFLLVDYVIECWKKGAILLEARDRRLEGDYAIEEMELVLKLGWLCLKRE